MSEEKDDSFIADGHVEGPSCGSLQDGAKFVITKTYGDRPEKFVTISKLDALPSYCPWILYKVKLKKPEKGSVYSVIYVDSCRGRHVYKKDVKDHLVGVRKMDEKKVKDGMRRLDSQIESLEHVDRDVDDEKLRKEIKKLVEPAFKREIYYEMLRYFSATFLSKFTDEQLAAIALVVVHAPYTFCFWTHARRILKSIKGADGKQLFPAPSEGSDPLLVDESYAYALKKTLLERDDRSVRYSSRYPMWSLNSADRGCTQWPNDEMIGCIDTTLKAALTIYLEMDNGLYSHGHTCYNLKDAKRTIPHAKEGIEFLLREGIATYTMGDAGKRETITKHHFELIEIGIAKHMQSKFKSVRTIDCSFYGSSYVKLFLEWIRAPANVGGATIDRILFVSANAMTTSYMKGATGLDFVSCDDITEKHFEKKTCLVIDKLQKISVIFFMDLMRMAREGMTLCAFGDHTDYMSNSRRGGGDVAGPLFARFPPARWHRWESSDPMRKTYECLVNQDGIILTGIHITPLDKPKPLLDHLKALSDETGDVNSYNIFCSNEEDKEEIMGILCRKIGGADCKYNRNCFMMGQKVHVVEDDYCGILTGVSDESRPKVPLNSKDINLQRGRYVLDIGGKKYSSGTKTFRHADVHVVTRFHGAPAPHGIFYITGKTSRRHIWCAAKYCTADLKLFIIHSMNVTDITDGYYMRPANDLYSKLRHVSIKTA